MNPAGDIRLGEPVRWILAFQRRSTIAWLNRLPLTYKHVAAFGYVGGDVGCWIFFDWRRERGQVSVGIGEKSTKALMGEFAIDADLIGIEARQQGSLFRLGAYCVPAVKHLIGLRSNALTPDGLYRDCLAAGAKPIV